MTHKSHDGSLTAAEMRGRGLIMISVYALLCGYSRSLEQFEPAVVAVGLLCRLFAGLGCEPALFVARAGGSRRRGRVGSGFLGLRSGLDDLRGRGADRVVS